MRRFQQAIGGRNHLISDQTHSFSYQRYTAIRIFLTKIETVLGLEHLLLRNIHISIRQIWDIIPNNCLLIRLNPVNKAMVSAIRSNAGNCL